MSFVGSHSRQPSTAHPPWAWSWPQGIGVGSCDVLLENVLFLVDNLVTLRNRSPFTAVLSFYGERIVNSIMFHLALLAAMVDGLCV